MNPHILSRRLVLGGAGIVLSSLFAPVLPCAALATEALDFDELYGSVGVLGLTFSEKVKALSGRQVTMKGYMAPPLKAEADFFVLTEIPMSICPFCSSDADWPDNIVVVYLERAQTFEQANALIEVRGTLEVGSWTDPATGFVSLLRIVGASLATA
ncbi:hypothetical protein MKI84_16450 [Ancylobacter sp. A5.8]|uniref:hypothetical protein n=1 Tax=Ancylobacter gelatini TaxID=2919920 RepID=UPI001F4E183B|nr:hypothetical protein [Ancylobacter gelatini]MCJ8144517.1 hypothetical protein [Ancylobacter gelatini]